MFYRIKIKRSCSLYCTLSDTIFCVFLPYFPHLLLLLFFIRSMLKLFLHAILHSLLYYRSACYNAPTLFSTHSLSEPLFPLHQQPMFLQLLYTSIYDLLHQLCIPLCLLQHRCIHPYTMICRHSLPSLIQHRSSILITLQLSQCQPQLTGLWYELDCFIQECFGFFRTGQLDRFFPELDVLGELLQGFLVELLLDGGVLFFARGHLPQLFGFW